MATRNRTGGKARKVVRDARTGHVRVRPAGSDAPSDSSEIAYADSDRVQEIGRRATARWAGLLDRLSE